MLSELVVKVFHFYCGGRGRDGVERGVRRREGRGERGGVHVHGIDSDGGRRSVVNDARGSNTSLLLHSVTTKQRC